MHIKNNDFKDRKGKIFITDNFLNEPDAIMMAALFSVFFPIAIETGHIHGYMGKWFYGYSDLFEKLEIGVIIPEYEVTFERKGSLILVKEMELKK